MSDVARVVVRFRKSITAVWIVIAVVLIPGASRIQETLDVSTSVPGSESARVEELIAKRFHSGFSEYAVLVITGIPDPRSAEAGELLMKLQSELSAMPIVNGIFSDLDTPDSLFVGEGGGTFMVVGLRPGTGRPDQLIPRLRAVTKRIADSARPAHPAIALHWTGEIPLNYDLRKLSARDAKLAERRVMPVTLLLLVISFGTLAASLLPLVAGGLSIALALGIAVGISSVWPLSILLQNIVTMLGLGLGIDYALLMVGRFREALQKGMPPDVAAGEAAARAGHTILLSGASVAIGFAALLMVPVNEIRSLAVGGLVVILVAVLLATTLLPALLSMIGHRVNWARLRPRPASGGSERWRRWGKFVCAHPLGVLLCAGAPMCLLAWQATRLSTELPRGDWLPPRMESSRGLHALERMQRSGIVHAIRVVIQLPENARWDSPQGWAAVRSASDRLASDPRVARVRSLPQSTGLTTPNLQLIGMMPAALKGALGSEDGRLALVEAMPSELAAQRGAMDLVREMRAAAASSLTGLEGSAIQIGGLAAFNVDYETAIDSRFRVVVGVVVAVTMLALMIGFRSVLIAAKAVVLNLLSASAAFGAVVLVFQDGRGIQLLGLSAPLEGTFTAVPIIVFCVVFGLSMDYEVFLVSRVAEARKRGMADADAIVEGLARTGGLITSAATIMIVVFAAFTMGDFVLMKILGFALSVAVLLDATVVRVAIGPALLRLAGKWNWWPGERAGSGNPAQQGGIQTRVQREIGVYSGS